MARNRKLNTFTLIELVVVVAIIAVLLSVGIGSFTLLRNSIDLDQATNELLGLIRTAQSRARNSSTSAALYQMTGNSLLARVDGFAIYFDSTSQYSMRYCIATAGAGSTSYNCSGIEFPNAKSAQYGNITLQVNGSGCNGIVFSKLSGNISGISAANSVGVETGTCRYRLTHSSLLSYREIIVNLAGNNIQLL